MKNNATNKMILGFELPKSGIQLWLIRQSFRMAGLSITKLVFQLGYIGVGLPRRFRKVLAKSKIHRSWFSAYTGAAIAKVIEREEWLKPRMAPYEGYFQDELHQTTEDPETFVDPVREVISSYHNEVYTEDTAGKQ